MLIPPLLLAALPQAPVPAPQPDAPLAPLSMARVELAEGELDELLAAGFDIPSTQEGDQLVWADVVVDAQELERLERLGYDPQVLIPDLQTHYAERLAASQPQSAGGLGTWLSPPFGQGAMGGYYTLGQALSVVDQIQAAYPALVAPRISLGKSLQNRDLWAFRVSDNPTVEEGEPQARFDALHHSREPMGLHAQIWFLLWLVENYGIDPLATYLIDERELWFIPVVNPDGYAYNQQIAPNGGGMWRKNRRQNFDGTIGVDLNRNYAHEWGFNNLGSSGTPSSETYRGPAPLSEPETAAMAAFFEGRDFKTALSSHCYDNSFFYSWGYDYFGPPNSPDFDAISALATADNGYPYGPASLVLYEANGVTIDHDFGVEGTLSWTVEIGNFFQGFWPNNSDIIPLAQDNLLMHQVLAQAAGPFPSVIGVELSDQGDGDGFYEPGENVGVSFVVKNVGASPTASAVQVSITSADLGLSAGALSASLPAGLSAFGTGTTSLATLGIDPSAAPGTSLSFTAQLDFEGLSSTTTHSVFVGVVIAIGRDELESDLGWIAGLPSDSASTGLWERGEPIGTASGGQAANPGADFTPGAGTQCYVTGNGGGSGGTDDVDDGLTTLISPRLDLSDTLDPHVRYARWFADLSEDDDAFQISISNDDGQSWVPLETLPGQGFNAWDTSTFRVADFVAPSDAVRLRFVAEDDPNNSVVEAAVDDLEILSFSSDPQLFALGSLELGSDLQLGIAGDFGSLYTLYVSTATASLPLPGIGTLLIDPNSATPILSGALGAGSVDRTVLGLPSSPSAAGATAHLQALLVGGGGAALTGRLSLTLQ